MASASASPAPARRFPKASVNPPRAASPAPSMASASAPLRRQRRRGGSRRRASTRLACQPRAFDGECERQPRAGAAVPEGERQPASPASPAPSMASASASPAPARRFPKASVNPPRLPAPRLRWRVRAPRFVASAGAAVPEGERQPPRLPAPRRRPGDKSCAPPCLVLRYCKYCATGYLYLRRRKSCQRQRPRPRLDSVCARWSPRSVPGRPRKTRTGVPTGAFPAPRPSNANLQAPLALPAARARPPRLPVKQPASPLRRRRREPTAPALCAPARPCRAARMASYGACRPRTAPARRLPRAP